MEGYDNMDNNSNNVSGIPNVSDIKFDDTPAESFDNLYGGNKQQSVGMSQNSGVNPSMGQPNIGIQSNLQVNPDVMNNTVAMNNVQLQSNFGSESVQPVTNNVLQSNSMGNEGNVVNATMNNVQPQPQINTMSNMPTMNSVAPNVSPESVMSVQPNAGVFNMNQEPMMTSNPTNISNNGADLSSVNIDAQKMQSIEEQLSKTSQYNPSDFQQEQIVIPTDNHSEKGKSGLGFIIVLFIILAVVIAFLPQITKLIK